jgi:hypothetical protein
VSSPATPPLVTDTTSTRQAERARRKTKDRIKTDHALMKHQLSTYEGRQFLWREIERHGVYEDIVTASDALMRELLGRRREGLRLLVDAGRFPELCNQMVTEARQRSDFDRREAQAAALAEKTGELETT